MRLVEFVNQLPSSWVLAPIYRKGAAMRSGKPATGKNPLEVAFDKDLGPADVALQLEKNENLGAVGLFTGPRSGLVILDVDRNGSALTRKWGESIKGAPRVTSTKKNAFKLIFRLPEEHWGEVSGFGHSEDHKDGYEVLWTPQGLIYGDYPGSKCGKWPAGSYTFEGDPEAVPVAPDWLIAEMKAAKTPTGIVKNRTALDLSDRTEDEVAVIVTECLDVIDNRGAGQRDHWIKVGMAIHSVLPNDLGLTLWAAWSAKDVEFADEWATSNPCEQPWSSFKPGRIGLGSLIYMADRVDPKRSRFTGQSKQILEAAESRIVTFNREVTLPFEEIIRRGMEIYEQDDVARMNYQLHSLAMEARYRDQEQLEKLLLDHITQVNQEGGYTMENRKRTGREFLIPGLLPYGYVVLLHGDAGCGKSATAMALMKHVVDGIPFQLKNQMVPIKPGPAIYFNADMSSLDFEEEYDLHEIKNGHRFRFQPDFNLYRQAQFVKVMNKVKPSIICIDSLSSCSGSKAADENKASFSQPLYWLSAKNGILWPACAILVLHHSNKSAGGVRGSSGIAAAVSEVWNISMPKKDSGLKNDQRVITIGKSRLNRSGESLLQTQNDDLTVSLVEAKKPEEMQTRAGSVAERIMNRLQTSKEWVTRQELNADPLVGGSVAAIKKTLQRLENRGVIEILEKPNPAGGDPIKLYRSLQSSPRGEIISGGQVPLKSVDDSSSRGDTNSLEPECPPVDLSAGASSEDGETLSPSPRARTEDEINVGLDQDQWNDDPVQTMPSKAERAKKLVDIAAEAARKAKQEHEQFFDTDVIDVPTEGIKEQSRIISRGLDDVIDV